MDDQRGLDSVYAGFVRRRDQAQAATLVRLLTCVNLAAKQDWRAAAWLLVHLFPDEFGPGVSARRNRQGGSSGLVAGQASFVRCLAA